MAVRPRDLGLGFRDRRVTLTLTLSGKGDWFGSFKERGLLAISDIPGVTAASVNLISRLLTESTAHVQHSPRERSDGRNGTGSWWGERRP